MPRLSIHTAGRVYSHYGKFHIIKDERLVSKWKVKLIFRGAYRLSGTGIVECLEIIGVMALLTDTDPRPYFTTDLRHCFRLQF